MRYCTICGAEVPEGSTFCGVCGKRLDEVPQHRPDGQ